mgnify:FL=1
MSEAIFVEGLTKSYHGKTVVDHLELSVTRGTVFGLLGANGAGKSTTIECMLGTKQADSGLMGLPQAVSGLRELKILKRFRVTPVSPVFILGVELSLYIVYCIVSLATLAAAALLWGVRLHGSLPAFLGS